MVIDLFIKIGVAFLLRPLAREALFSRPYFCALCI